MRQANAIACDRPCHDLRSSNPPEYTKPAIPGGMFVLTKPVGVDIATRTLRAATGLMLNEFRRYFRHPAQLPVVITKDSGEEFQATSINFSHGGLAVRMAALNVISPRDAVRARFTRPGASTCIETRGKVAWAGGQGRAGLYSECISARDRKQLEEWLTPGLPQKGLFQCWWATMNNCSGALGTLRDLDTGWLSVGPSIMVARYRSCLSGLSCA